ncbi:hypothetical protein STVA_38210 [Allostella vacuolata]|nr:hypothetical protein STVA_38210 [Stella vacuolata]
MKARPLLAGPAGFVLLHAAALAGGWLAVQAKIPLPWMIGSMLAAMAMALSGVGAPGARRSRRVGQMIVGLAIGSYFTADALAQTIRHFDLMIATAAATLGFGFVAMAILRRLSRTDATTAFFASVPGGPAEMAQLAERHGVAGAPVALAQAFRIALLVLIVPPAMTWAGLDGSDPWLPPAIAVDLFWLPILVLAAIAAGFALDRIGVSNAALLGAIAVAGGLAATGQSVTAMPAWLVAGGQWLLGASLGAGFTRTLLGRQPRFIAAALASTLVLIALTLALAVAAAWWTGIPWPTLVLALAPGSVTEMSLTAKLLHLGVPMVVAFHIVRIVILVLITPAVFAGLRRIRHRMPQMLFGGD